MNLTQVIHQRWAADSALNAALDATRVFTGPNVSPGTPLAVISQRGVQPSVLFGDGSGIDLVTLRVEIHHESLDAGAAILAALYDAFDRSAFELEGDDRVLQMRRTDATEHQGADGVWRLTVDFNCTVYLATGA